MIDPEMAKVYVKVAYLKEGMNWDEMKEKEVNPAIREANKQILKKKKHNLNMVSISGLLGFIAIIILLALGDIDAAVVLIVCGVALVFEATCVILLGRLNNKENICPYCYAYQAWVRIRKTQIGQEETTIAKQIETKHYAPRTQNKGKLGAEFQPQYYQGKSVTTTRVPATRYIYREAYQCSCCKNVKYVTSSTVAEN